MIADSAASTRRFAAGPLMRIQLHSLHRSSAKELRCQIFRYHHRMKHFPLAILVVAALPFLSSCNADGLRGQLSGTTQSGCRQWEQELSNAPKTCHKDANCTIMNNILYAKSKLTQSLVKKWNAAKCPESGGGGGAPRFEVCESGECTTVGMCGNHHCETKPNAAYKVEWPPSDTNPGCPQDCPRQQAACNKQKALVAKIFKTAQRCDQDEDCVHDGYCNAINADKLSTYQDALWEEDALCGPVKRPEGWKCSVHPTCVNHVCQAN